MEHCSHCGEVYWSFVTASHNVLASLRATTHTVSVLSVCFFCMCTKRFTAHLNINFVKTSVSKPSTQGLRFLKSRHPFSPLRSGSRQGPP